MNILIFVFLLWTLTMFFGGLVYLFILREDSRKDNYLAIKLMEKLRRENEG